MRIKILIPLLVLLATGVVLAAQVTISWWDVYYKYAQVKVEKHRIGMETLISFVEEKGRDSRKLESIKSEFLSANQEFKLATEKEDKVAIDLVISKMREIVVRFRKEAKIQLAGLGKEALKELNDALEANESYFNSLLDEARTLHKDRNIEIFDWAIGKGEEAVEKLKEYDKDTTQVEAKLNEIKGKREKFLATMNEALTACYGIENINCQNTANLGGNCATKVQNYCTLRHEIKNDFSQLRDLIYQAAGLK